MKTKLLALVAGIAISSGFVLGAGIVQAEKPAPTPTAHRHYILAGNGEKVYVGPNYCDIQVNDQGFTAFHQKVHVPNIGTVVSEGC